MKRLRGLAKQALMRTLRAVADVAMKLPKNGWFYGYTIQLQGSPYLTRIMFPRIAHHRVMLHYIHRADRDKDCHNHPWAKAWSVILTGGYYEVRAATERDVTPDLLNQWPFALGALPIKEHGRWLKPGAINRIERHTFHRIIKVLPGTWTLFVAGERLGGWGFLADIGTDWAMYVPHAEYITVGGRPVEPGAGA